MCFKQESNQPGCSQAHFAAGGINRHPIGSQLEAVVSEVSPTRQPPIDFETFCNVLRKRREELLAILTKSIKLGEPVECS